MRVLLVLALLTGCCSSEPQTPPGIRVIEQHRKRPQDMIEKVLADERIPTWLKYNYAEWLRYAYDLEVR